MDRWTALKVILTMLVLGVAAWLRLAAITYDRPYEYHPDEWLIAKPALNIAATGDPNPHTFLYPTLLTYADTAVVQVVHAVTGTPLTVQTFPGHDGAPPNSPSDIDPSLYVYVQWGRTLVGFLGVLAVLTVLFAGLAAGRARIQAAEAEQPQASAPQAGQPAAASSPSARAWIAGLAGAAFMAVAVLPVVNSRYLTTDVPSALFSVATLAVTLLAISRPPDRTSDRLLILAGFLVGLAASSKYNAGAVAMVPAVGYLTRAGSIRAIRGWLPGAIRSRTPYLVALAAVGGFVLTTPMAIFDTRAVLSGIHYQIHSYAVVGHVGAQGNTIGFYLDYLWNTGFGPVLSVLALAGILWALWRHRAADLVIVGFTLVYFAIVSLPSVRFERNLLPLVPFVALLAGRFVADAVLALRDVKARRYSLPMTFMSAAFLAMLLAQPAALAIGDARVRSRPDTRTAALEWANQSLPAGAAVVREAYTPQLSAERFSMYWETTLSSHDLAWYREHGFRYAIASSLMYDRYLTAGGEEGNFYAGLLAQSTVYSVKPAADMQGPTIVILDLGPGPVAK
jgi:hypothetical protein